LTGSVTKQKKFPRWAKQNKQKQSDKYDKHEVNISLNLMQIPFSYIICLLLTSRHPQRAVFKTSIGANSRVGARKAKSNTGVGANFSRRRKNPFKKLPSGEISPRGHLNPIFSPAPWTISSTTGLISSPGSNFSKRNQLHPLRPNLPYGATVPPPS
jgi:hypothetical protein